MFIAYIKGISYLKDIKRIFAYHGAEHKSIFAFEADLPLTVDQAIRLIISGGILTPENILARSDTQQTPTSQQQLP